MKPTEAANEDRDPPRTLCTPACESCAELAKALLTLVERAPEKSRDGLPCWCIRDGREPLDWHDDWCNRARLALRKAGAL